MPPVDTTNLRVSPGKPYPMGSMMVPGGFRFTIFSRHATRVWLALFDKLEAKKPVWEFEYDSRAHRLGDVWSLIVEGLEAGAYYMFRMDGPFEPELGHRFNPEIFLLDPYAKAFRGDIHDGTMKCIAVREELDWSKDVRPRTPMRESIIYETHVRGLTRHESACVAAPGTYRGLIEKIPHLQELGVTAVELLPIHEFGETLMGRCSLDGSGELSNYWGYSNIGFFAPSFRYAANQEAAEHLLEFREMVQAFHEAGIEVILDVVFNHTSEGNELGPTLCFRGIDNSIYYILDEDGGYQNYSGCGNTLNCNHPLVRDFILDCLRYWVAEMHVDGFRFDLASILGRDQKGEIIEDAPLVERIAEDPVLRDAKLIAEAWDAGGAYQVGSFGDVRWAEWNGRYRDEVRQYWRGDAGMRAAFASRITGSSDMYQWAGRTAEHSINFITCHDGFTLRDLVSYNEKHNEANGEGNQDGSDENYSSNFGVEGDTDDPEINALRLRMQKNYLATLFLSLGVPMILGGDEFGRTQGGNNNAYCQDNEISWYDWNLREQEGELFRFCKEIIALRKRNRAFSRHGYFNGNGGDNGEADLTWFSESGKAVDWESVELPIGCCIRAQENDGVRLAMLFNSTDEPVTFQLPEGAWRVAVDTSQAPPHDICTSGTEARSVSASLELPHKCMAVLCQEI